MKLINKTRVEDEALMRVLKLAARSINGVKTKNVTVETTTGSRVRGVAWPRFIKLIFPSKKTLWYSDELSIATNIFRVAAHEFCHVRDFQSGKKFVRGNKAWRNRPQEKRAMSSERVALRKLDKDAGI